jgi:hypothetical protein
MLAVQIHREIGHADHIAARSSAQSAYRSISPSVLVSHCQLCELGLQTESVPPPPVRPIMDRTLVRVRHDDVSPRILTVASAGHIWRSRAPPGFPIHMA